MAQSLEVSEDALKLMVAEHGVRGTARLLGMDERQTETFRKRVQRGGWMNEPDVIALRAVSSPPGVGRPAMPLVPKMSPAAAVAAELAALGSTSRLGFAKASAGVAAFVSERDPQENLIDAQNVKAAAQTANMVFGWAESAPQVKIRLDVLGGNAESQIVDVESSAEPIVSDTESWDNELDSY